ncbi:MAG: hypothetical protein JF600_01210 [Xanthomonadales bacterium]|nr:hypothetical protein [Xanthomonadales bacterium]
MPRAHADPFTARASGARCGQTIHDRQKRNIRAVPALAAFDSFDRPIAFFNGDVFKTVRSHFFYDRHRNRLFSGFP